MNIQSITNINVDFYDKKYILINAKQYDRASRFLSVTCYNHGELCSINSKEHSAYIRYKKPDGYSVFNFCDINSDGKIIVELTEQMLVVDGISYADLVIVNKGNASVNTKTGEIVSIDGSSILSTMTFCIDVSESAVNNSDIESTHEFNLLNTKLEEYWADFEDIVTTAKSWAEGNTGIRTDEDIHNAKYWAEIAHQYVVGDIDDKLVVGVRGEAEDSYRVGYVILTPENIGAIPNNDIATVSEIKTYLGI
jgi:hypothetical protein